MLSDVEGRLERTLHLPDGRFVPEGAIQVRLKDEGAHSFQLLQRAPERYELKVVIGSRPEYDRVLPGLLDALRDLLGESVVVEPTYHERLEPGPRGVFRYVMPLNDQDKV